MPANVSLLSEKSVILIELIEPVSPEDVKAAQQETAQLASTMDGTIYRVVDMRPANFTFSQVVVNLKEGAAKRQGSAADERFVSYYAVGDSKMAKLIVDSLSQQQYGAITVNVVGTPEDALQAIGNN